MWLGHSRNGHSISLNCTIHANENMDGPVVLERQFGVSDAISNTIRLA